MSFVRHIWRRELSPAHPHERTAIGVAIRRHHLDIVVGNGAAVMQARISLLDHRSVDAMAIVPLVVHTLRALLAEQNIVADTLCGIGIGLAISRDAVQRAAVETPSWDGASLGGALRDAFGIPVYLATLTHMETLGEQCYGVGYAVSDMAYIAIGTTVTAGIMMNGKLHRGDTDAIGHMALDPRGAQCHCGQRGCLETSAGAAAIIVTAQSQGSVATTLTQVIAAARHGDASCLNALEHAGVALGTALANTAVLLNPAMIVLGGATMTAGDLLLTPIRHTLMQHPLLARAVPFRIVPSLLGGSAAALGGMVAGLDHGLKST